MWPHKDSEKLIAIHYADSNYVIHLINRLVILSRFLPGVIRLFVPHAALYLLDQISRCHLSHTITKGLDFLKLRLTLP